MFIKSGGLKKIGIWLAIWGFVKTIWDAIGHIGNVQTLWDMISAAVQYWPSFLRAIVWVATSWWFPLIASTICLVFWWFLSRREKKFAAVTFEDAIIFPSERHDGTQILRHNPGVASQASPSVDKVVSEAVTFLEKHPLSPPEDRRMAGLKDQLANKIKKGKRIETWPESGRDESMRRNQRQINELLAQIKRLEGEQSKPVAIVTESGPKGFQIEALPPVPDVLNLTQHTWHEGAKIMFTGDAVLGVTNRLTAQGIDLVSFRLLSISPPMKAVKAHKPSTLDAALKRIDFSEDIPATLVAGKTNDVRLFKATRPFSVNSLKDISIEFYGKWPEGYYSVFTPSERHELTVEVTGKGVGREEATFELRFSCKKHESVFSISTIRSAVGKA